MSTVDIRIRYLSSVHNTDNNVAVVMIGGCSGGLAGPSDLYNSLSYLLNDTTVQFSPTDTSHVSNSSSEMLDILLHIKRTYKVERVILIGWSAGASVITKATLDAYGNMNTYPKVIGLIYLAGQLYDNPLPSLQHLCPEIAVYVLWGKKDDVFHPSLAPIYLEELGPLIKNKQIKLYHEADHDFKGATSELLQDIIQWIQRLTTNPQASLET